VLLYVLAGVAVGVAGGYMLRKAVAESKIRSAEERAKLILEQAERNAEAKVREALVTAKEEAVRLRQEVEQELRERRHELQRLEGRLLQKEEALDRRHAQLERREEQLNRRAEALERKHAEADRLIQQQRAELERLSGLTAEEAKQYLLKTVEEEIRHDMAVMIREMEQQAKEEAEKRARNVIGLAIQRLAADYVSEATVSVVTLPSDDMKGASSDGKAATSARWRRRPGST